MFPPTNFEPSKKLNIRAVAITRLILSYEAGCQARQITLNKANKGVGRTLLTRALKFLTEEQIAERIALGFETKALKNGSYFELNPILK